MIDEQEGLDEIISLFDSHHPSEAPLDFEKGLLQAIGYKEFYPYYQLLKSGVPPPTQDDLQQAKARLKQKTIEYTKYQIKWLEKRIGRAFSGGELLLRVELDDPKEYESKALKRASEHFELCMKDYESSS
jgi:tRNA A37 N6-isopentenylltransferase MiaA